MDYSNKTLVDLFYTELRGYLKSHNGLFALIDPHIIMNYRDHDGNITESNDVEGFIEQMEGLGTITVDSQLGILMIHKPGSYQYLILKVNLKMNY